MCDDSTYSIFEPILMPLSLLVNANSTPQLTRGSKAILPGRNRPTVTSTSASFTRGTGETEKSRRLDRRKRWKIRGCERTRAVITPRGKGRRSWKRILHRPIVQQQWNRCAQDTRESIHEKLLTRTKSRTFATLTTQQFRN